jgi:outer membrane protein assembly factor BamD (BamD/ComL family)
MAALFVAAGVALTVLRILLGLQSAEPLLPVIWQAAMFGLVGVGLGVVAIGVAVVLGRVRHLGTHSAEGMAPLRQSLQELRSELATLRGPESTDATSGEEVLAEQEGVVSFDDGPITPETQQVNESATNPPQEPLFRQLMTMLEEVREIAALSDDQRRQLLADGSVERKNAILRQVDDAIQQREWSRAARVLGRLQVQYPHDATVQEARQRLDTESTAHENDSLTHTIQQVEALMAVAAWDSALDRSKRFTEDFPHNEQGFHLLQRVRAERMAYRNQTAQVLFAQIKQLVEHRQWRKALATSERLIERFSDHPRADKVRVQLALIRENADIEHRHEMEGRLKDLIRGRQYHQATLVAEELLARYPDSRQADLLEELLPKLRHRAMEEELFASDVPQDD